MSGRDDEAVGEPKWRVGVGMVGILVWMVLCIVAAVEIADYLTGWPILLQMLFYLVAGIVWILPLKPALRWMETARWR